jgi:hypothetical protein
VAGGFASIPAVERRLWSNDEVTHKAQQAAESMGRKKAEFFQRV